MAYSEEDFLQLSGLQHFRFCRRRWALIHIEHQWAENYRTIDIMPQEESKRSTVTQVGTAKMGDLIAERI